MRKTCFLFLVGAILCIPQTVSAQISRLGEDVEYEASANVVVSNGDSAPFWFSNNKYGLSSTKENSGYLRASIKRDAEADSSRNWRIGYGADIAVPFHHDRKFVVQQLYGDFQYKAMRLSLGQKERPSEFKNPALSSGGLTLGMNARPIPQIRLELPDFWAIPGTRHWLSVKAHIAYGMYTDNHWQKDFVGNGKSLYSCNSFFHSKAAFFRIGNKDKFPLTVSVGLEMATQFAGEAYNYTQRSDYTGQGTKIEKGIKAFWHALIPGGQDANDGDYANASGNQLGSWHLSADYDGKTWGARFYMEHFFEDQSQMFWQYNWKDMLYGIEVRLPKNPVVGTILYEHLGMMHQSGPIYHDATTNVPEQISAIDNYYNHHIYGAWQHAGYTMGTPLIISPLYNNNGQIHCNNNRIQAHHFGIQGHPISELGYRVLFTHERSLGTYDKPLPDPQYGNFFLAEATYRPSQIKGLSITASYGQNGGQLLGHSKGGMLTVAYQGFINKKHKDK